MLKKSVLGALVVLSVLNESKAQEVNYSVVENTPYTHSLNIGISGLDFSMIGGALYAGPGASIHFRPLPIVEIEGDIYTGMYANDARGADSLVTGFKKSGGLMVKAGGSFVWYRKGKNFIENKGDTEPKKFRFDLKTSSTSNGSVTKYIMFPYNRMVERSLRGGGYMNNYPTAEGISSSQGVYFGIGKMTYKSATLDIDGYGELTRSFNIGYHADFMIGNTLYHAPIDGSDKFGGMGLVLGLDFSNEGGLFPLSATFEVGKVPGMDKGMMRLKIAGNILAGKQHYKGEYKTVRFAKKTISRLIQMW